MNRALFLSVAAAPALATLSISNTLGSNMVFQRDAPFAVWGWTNAGSIVRGELGADAKAGTADSSGLWKLVFSPVAVGGGALQLFVSSGAENMTLTGLLAGDVVFCSGQSNSARGEGGGRKGGGGRLL